MNIKALEQLYIQVALFQFAVGLTVMILLFWATYWVIKAGVRDGIREAGSSPRSHQRAAAPPGFKWALVRETAHTEDMRAD